MLGVPATEALKKGLEDLQEMCGHMLHCFKVPCMVYFLLTLRGNVDPCVPGEYQ